MKRMNKQTLISAAVGAALLAIGAAGGWWWSQRSMASMEMGTPEQASGQGKVLYWYDPMYPQQQFDKPGKSPFMDMALVPKYADGDGEAAGVKIDPSITQSLGMRLAPVTSISLASQVDATGVIGFNERDVAIVQSRASGFVERVASLAPGDVVKAGQALVDVQVPDWLSAQHEFLALKSAGDAALLAAARDRLRSVGMSDGMIREVESAGQPRARFTVTAPISGVIQSLDVRNGMTLTAGQPLVRINGLSTVWLEVAVPEALAAQVQPGAKATATVAGNDTPVTGKVAAIVPVLNDASRSLRVRVELPNAKGLLHPGQSAQVSLGNASKENALSVPTEAVIRTGKRSLVMVATEGGRYEPVEVLLGGDVGDRTIIKSGLTEGQQVVASGQFLIDSEASLKGITAKTAASMPAAMSLHEADARIVELGDKEITLAHGPFKTLSMPGMTMPFPLANPALAKGFKAGDRVRVGVRETDDGLVVERLQKLEGNAP
ncbi:MAG: efflux RND transporter periplasmic adaptor subunit [Rhodocyclaceae bacterium]|nr:efflux RND transporter periplasmic adaptor subunit [Rhodocyclaceae bacterium]